MAIRGGLPLVRLPVVLFPGTPVTFKIDGDAALGISDRVLAHARRREGELLGSLPGAPGLGVRMIENSMENHVRDDIAHFTVAERVRISPSFVQPDGVGSIREQLRDQFGEDHAARLARVSAEAAEARCVLTEITTRNVCELDLGIDDLGVDHVDLCRHPLWAASKVIPKDPMALSFWLPARLPLTTDLRAQILLGTCPLWRLQSAVDIMRFLLLDAFDERYTHRFMRIVNSPATDVCGRGLSAAPQVIVGKCLASGSSALNNLRSRSR